MKYVLLLGDGMADTPVPALGNRTPLEAANHPHMDFLAAHGDAGLAKTIPDGMPTGSDTANMACLGFDPRVYYSGRSPLEAVSMGVSLAPDDVSFRCNLVTLSDEAFPDACSMVDYSSGEITTEEARELVAALAPAFEECAREQGFTVKLHPGISYRHCFVISHAETGTHGTPPHDITGRKIAGYLPEGRYASLLLSLTALSRSILADHPVNVSRVSRGLRPANAAWFWGEGTKPALADFREKYGLRAGVVCAVDLIRGLGLCAGMETVSVPGATGAIETNFRGKGEAAIRLLRGGCDFVYIHIESPDECGHHGEPEKKVWAIESIDREVLGPILDEFRGEPLSVLLMPDHPTPIAVRTHTGDPVPFVIWRSDREGAHPASRYTEAEAAKTGEYLPEGFRLMDRFLK
ncbi:MAG: cofactor-independent phosphoglycerate mutase [Clostridiaceae bacterium]|nr:cofactor-independent phosphoglycerate mutase [Clostridiaceae bacterium]